MTKCFDELIKQLSKKKTNITHYILLELARICRIIVTIQQLLYYVITVKFYIHLKKNSTQEKNTLYNNIITSITI